MSEILDDIVAATLDAKLVGESVFVDFDFTDIFNPGVTITGTPTVTIATKIGIDVGPNLVAGAAPALDTTRLITSQLVNDGLAECTYLLTCTATGTDNSVESIQLLLPVVASRYG